MRVILVFFFMFSLVSGWEIFLVGFKIGCLGGVKVLLRFKYSRKEEVEILCMVI